MRKLSEILTIVIDNPGTAFFYTPPIYQGARSWLFNGATYNIHANHSGEIEDSLNQIEKLIREGKPGFGYIAYEAGYHFEELPQNYESKDLLSFFFLNSPDDLEVFQSSEIQIEQSASGDSLANNFRLNISKESYLASVNSIKEKIAEGYTYQTNFTVKLSFSLLTDIRNLFTSLLFQQSAEYISILNTGGKIVISFSPELFFEVDKRTNIITTKPMKGTIRRGFLPDNDANLETELKNSNKDRAENIMIVDLLRNDISKICEFNSVKPINQFEIKKYESLYQMVTTVKGKLKTDSFAELVSALFPCGSITGAPKRKTMEIISRLEKNPRGTYTGAIGMILNDKYIFNVPIRTLEIRGDEGELGVGSGIVWDSTPEKEYEEVLLKSNFLKNPVPEFRLIETMRLEDGDIFLRDEHIKRLKKAADHFIFNFNENILNDIFDRFSDEYRKGVYKFRIELDKWGNYYPEISDYEVRNNLAKVIISQTGTSSEDRFLYFKTTNRKLYNSSYKMAKIGGFDEVLFFNTNGELCEGAISNIILESDGKLVTPIQSSGLLNGTLRSVLLDNNMVSEKIITKDNLLSCTGIYLVNSLFKLKAVEKIVLENSEAISFDYSNNTCYERLFYYINNLN